MISKRTGRAVVLLAGLLGLAGSAFAEPRLSQSVSRREVGTEDIFTVTVVVTGTDGTARVTLPSSDDFEILGQSKSTQLSLGSGFGGPERVTRFTLRMRANRAGHLTIPGATLTTAQGQTLRAEPNELTVKSGHVAQADDQNDGNEPDPADPFASLGVPGFGGNLGQMLRQFDQDFDDGFPDPFGRMERVSKNDVQLRVALDRRSVYPGEQATLSVYLLSRVPVAALEGLQMPKIEGALVEDVETPKQVRGEERIINGVPYRAYLLTRRALFPMKSGKLEIGAAQVQVTAGGLFSAAHLSPSSAPVTLDVKPLPPGGPADGQEAVGQWTLSVEAPKQARLGEPVTVRMTAEGTGDLKGLPMPRIEAPPGLKVYEPTTSDKPTIEGGRLGGKRVQEIVIVPERTGDFTLPALALPYFDPDTRQHEVSRTKPLSFTVLPGTTPTPTASADEAQGPKNVITPATVRPIRHDARPDIPAPPPWRRPWMVALLAGPIIAWAGVELATALRRRAAGRAKTPSPRELDRSARRHLSEAERLKSRPPEFYAAVERGLTDFVEARLRTRAAGLTLASLETRLEDSGMDPARSRRLLKALEDCHAGRYAPSVDPAAMEQALALARDAVEGRPAR